MEHVTALRNIRLYRWSMMLMEPMFWGPIIISYIIHAGHMSLPQVYFMEGIVLVLLVVLEIPTGALADSIGRKKTLLLGTFLVVLASFLFTFISSPLWVWTINIMLTVGAALRSGADSAFLYDSLKEVGKEHEYQKIQGATLGNRLLIMAFASLGAGFLAEIDMRLPILLSVPSVLAAFLIMLFFKEPQPKEAYRLRQHLDLMKVSVLFVANHKALKWIVLFSTLIGVVSKVWFFTYNPYFELVDLDLRWYGVLFFFLNVVAWFFSRYAYLIEKRFSELACVVTMVLLLGLPILLMGTFVTTAMVGMILFQNVLRGFSTPFFEGFVNRHIDSSNRATVISIRSAINGAVQFIAMSGFAIVLGIVSLPESLEIVGVVTLALGAYGIYSYRKIFR